MATENPTSQAQEVIKSGNSFVWKTFIGFVLVHFLILGRPTAEVRSFNQRVGTDLKILEDERSSLDTDIRNLNRRLGLPRSMQLGKPAYIENRVSESEHRDSAKAAAAAKKERERVAAKREQILERRLKLEEDWVLLEKAKIRRELKIPGTEASMGESEIKKLYPLGLTLTLAFVLWSRRRLFERLDILYSEAKSAEADRPAPPFWAAPVPFGRYGISYLRCILLNLAGLLMIGFAGLLLIRFAHRDEFYLDPLMLFIDVVAGLAVASAYAYAVVIAIRKSV